MFIRPQHQNWIAHIGVILSAVVGSGAIMLLLGSSLVKEYRNLELQAAAKSGALYVEGFLAPHAHEFFSQGQLSDESKLKLESLIERLPVAGYFDTLKIWDRKGQMIFSTDGSTADEDEYPDDLQKALHGDIVVELYTDIDDHPDATIQPPFLEIHAPIYDVQNSQVIAVGEVYQDANDFLKHRASIERSIWGVLFLASAIAVCGLMLLLTVQHRTHLRHVTAINAISLKNRTLKEEADHARISASHTNEQLLNQIGAELHDGPIQMLTLLLLGLGRDSTQTANGAKMSTRELGDQIMAELRTISSGLILPELHGLSLAETLRLAASHHHAVTGNMVQVDLGNLPSQVEQDFKICCYRIIQEGMMNAHRHAGGIGLRVSASVSEQLLTIIVSDEGTLANSELDTSVCPQGGIGLRGAKQRLKVFLGTLDIRKRDGGGTELIATVPLNFNRTGIS